MENATYQIQSAALRKLEPKPMATGEDHKTTVVVEFTEQLAGGGRFPISFDLATDGSAPKISPLFQQPHGVLPWRSMVLQVPRRVQVQAHFPNQETIFDAVLKTIQVTEKWDGEQLAKYRITFEKFPEPTLDGVLGYYLGRKGVDEQTGKRSACAYVFDITDLGSAVRSYTETDKPEEGAN